MKIHGIRVPHHKNTASSAPVRLPLPTVITIPMSMHIGRPSAPIVKKGDSVKVGQKIAEASAYISAPVHSGVSGTVKKVDEMLISNGQKVPCIVIEPDGLQEISEEVKPPVITDHKSFVQAVADSGSVGLGGAGFPTNVKLNVRDLNEIEAVVINAAECEPYITSDTRTALDKTEYIFKGIDAFRKYMKVRRFIIGIENNKPDAIEKLRSFAQKTDDVEVHVLPSIYPQGGEKVLVYNTMHRLIPKGSLPLDVGAVVINITTLAFLAEYFETGMPLVERCVTLDGSAVKEPKNVIVPVGMPISEVIEAAGGLKSEAAKILYGGPMMGIAVPDIDAPILKNTNAVTVMDAKEAAPPKTTPCINCGACLNHCPLKLDPRAIAKAYKKNSDEELKQLQVDLCMECGCCGYVCPAKRPLVQTNKLAKAVLRIYKESNKKEEKQ
ncbi:MAG: electron transport complex subunit RsxC [Ruminococcus sp.]|nr:electron transport complex subunit RsxC [Ruminococcus sp.]